MSELFCADCDQVIEDCICQQPLTLTEYQERAATTATWSEGQKPILYCTLGLVGEAGEVANKLKKVSRGDYTYAYIREAVGEEIGDVLWYAAMLARELDLDLGELAQANLDKLASRKERGKIQGAGDVR